MNTLELKQNLSEQYDLICFEDLKVVSDSPGFVFELFYKLYKPEYLGNERLVFYSKQTPNDLLIQHLYKAANTIDISNFFILIVAPNIEPVLTKNLMCSTDKVCFDFLDIEISDASDLRNNFIVPDTICPMPWMHLEVGVTGEVRPCCVYNESISSIQNKSLADTFYSNELEDVRQSFLQGKKISQCDRCWNAEKQGLTSHRQKHLQLWNREFLGLYLGNPTIASLDLKPSNLCNFKCRICSPSSSSLYAHEAAKHQDIIVKDTSNNADIIFENELPLLINNLRNIDFYGGEPFYIKQISSFIEQTVKEKHCSHLRLHFNTNGSVYPDKLENHWKNFNHVDIQFSIDSVGDRFELERGGKWQDVESNIKKFIGLNLPNMTLGIMPVISLMNVLYLEELFDWALRLDLPVHPIVLEHPHELSITNLTYQLKQTLIEKYRYSDHSELKKLYSAIEKIPARDDAAQKFQNKMQYFDNVRNEDFNKSHSELATLMRMC